MKKYLLFFLISVLPVFVSAQDEELTAEVWYLKNVEIGNETYHNPNAQESNIYFWFGMDKIFSYACITGGLVSNFEINVNEQEILLSNLSTYPGMCEDPESIDFRNAYFDVVTQSNTFSYAVTPLENDTKGLTWTSPDGNRLNFTNQSYYLAAPPELTQNLWHLHYVKKNNEIHYPPNNEEVNDVVLEINGYSFITSVCAPLGGTFGFVPETNEFNILEMYEGMVDCNPFLGNGTFKGLYFSFFWANHYEVLEYEFIQNNDSKTLIITDIEGNQLVYGDTQLGTTDQENKKPKLYPNPVSGELTIESANLKVDHIRILDMNGKNILEQSIQTSKFQVDFSRFPKGVYIIHLESNGKTVRTEKIIKN